jgi:hypothetical protein
MQLHPEMNEKPKGFQALIWYYKDQTQKAST